MQARRAGLTAAFGVAAVLVAGCGSSPGGGSAAGAPQSACVTRQEAVRIWTSVNSRLLAVELDPHHAGASAVTSGTALAQITSYLQRQLISPGFTEREVDRLDALRVVEAGCNGVHLILNVTMTVVEDDYLNAAGIVNHSDPSVGRAVNLLEEYIQTGGVWREIDFSDLSQPVPSPTPTLLGFGRRACYTLA